MKERYQFANGQLILEDPELELAIHETFQPVLIPEEIAEGYQLKSGHRLNVSYHSDGTLEEAYLEKDNQQEGQAFLYYSSGKVKMESYYKNGLLHGPSTFFSEEGKPLAQGWFLDGKQVGKNYCFYENGTPYSIQRFVEGRLHGLQEYFYANGNIKTKLFYKDGVLLNANFF